MLFSPRDYQISLWAWETGLENFNFFNSWLENIDYSKE